ncbi:peroxisomal carnitine O-octanoyltransferase [Teleopsis dalmanni]|uniref:peroxisomal carnitine O-octanoyltransferase n=1 Tax=Teleopsis dalmanni TaxID=139649 RepID=UPI0018CCD001|nr:peroxisomal carnitine O-octanoyltransferase [Teleopsis dalmanni]XP_037949238.1 peroxisomal carnitine O-octanoyltransferase [Teleopsis dalmanni]XP_037949240.1 peroxisomal carnitine O-octanoyltransferase [Teleopsis dalmanni]XP_037949241.1 peroxisomal carnitine O-octanoyltransferase [Teleopsis dalmanni]
MDRAGIYFIDKDDENTYDFDETLPPLPLPDLKDTLQRYYETLKPFGTPEELANSRQVIEKFEKGIGKELHAKLKQRASKMKNWLDEWWDSYGYHMLRFPLNPYIVMAMPLRLELLGIPETSENFLKNYARIIYHTAQFWDLLRKAKIKPLSSNGGKIKYSSALYKRFFSTTRVPGVEIDHIEGHFKIVSEGKTPTHVLISGRGRLFMFECVDADDNLITPQQILVMLQRVRTIINVEPLGDCVPVLTHDERTTWANNRQQLKELSPANADTLKLIESSSIVIALDEHEPRNYEEVSQFAVTGDFHSKWGDRSSTCIGYKNGRFSLVGEHSCYDGTVSVSYALFIQLSLFEEPEPDWSLTETGPLVGITELNFDLNDTLKQEIKRVMADCEQRRTDVIITHEVFDEYAKENIKSWKLHPDSFVQVVVQLAYALMHDEIAPIYETALMRHYYNGRTETLRSCTSEVYKFLKTFRNPKSTNAEIVNDFRNAVEHHKFMMNEARKGHGVDRHLFGLWCIAYENKIDIPEFYEDPLYAKSGGGGNFVLSTSTLGFTANVGFVAPMTLDGYGVFYSITSDAIYISTTVLRDSTKTSAHKFNATFMDTFRKIRTLLDDAQNSKL